MRYVESRGAYRSLVGKHEEKRRLGKRGCRREDDNKIDLQEITMAVNVLLCLRIWTVAGRGEHGNEHSGYIKCGGFLDCLRKV